jgi:hypothetical protein
MFGKSYMGLKLAVLRLEFEIWGRLRAVLWLRFGPQVCGRAAEI